MESHLLRKAVRRALLATAAASLVAPLAHAQTSDTPVIKEVVVTGSRIAREELQSSVPVQIIDEQFIQQSGAANAADILRSLPAVGTAAYSSSNSNFLTSGAGANTINLRNLGDSRTLVLVNGRRFVAGIAGDSAVDLNNIPTDFIDHVEVVTGGASALYGSEAIAGVVNVILKKGYEGVGVRGQYGETTKGGGVKWSSSLTAGTPFSVGDSPGNFMFNITHDVDHGLPSSARELSQFDRSTGGVGPGFLGPYSTRSPQGYFLPGDDAQFTFNKDNTLKFGFTSQNAAGLPVDSFNRDPSRMITVPVTRTLVSSLFNVELTQKTTGYAELTYSTTSAKSNFEGSPIDYNMKVYPTAQGDTALDALDPTAGMPITNVFIPAPVQAVIAARNADADPDNDILSISFRRRLSDIANRGAESKRQMFRAVVGANGEVFDNYKWDAYYLVGRTTDAQISFGEVNTQNFRNALDSIIGPAGTPICRDPVARAEGCVAVNIFGYNSITPAASAYIAANQTRDATIQQEIGAVTLTGDLFSLPAGAVGFALGVEHRRESSKEIWDSLTNLGLSTGNQLPNTFGAYDVTEGFVETLVPILKDVPFAEYLGAEAAFRHGNYSTVGGVNSWRVGGEWAPVNDLRFRAVYSRATRAPNIGELYQPRAETFPGDQLSDPCDGVTATSGGPFAAACRAIPGVSTQIANNGSLAYTSQDYQTINGFQGGNPTLHQETSKTLTLGLVFTPSFFSGFSATVDYFDIDIDDAIDSIPLQTTIEQCLATGSATFCQNVIRFPSGRLKTVNNDNVNVASIKTTGVDLGLRYAWNITGADKLNASLAYTRLLKLEKVPYPGGDLVDNLGELNAPISGDRLGAGFKNRAQLTAMYEHGPFSVNWTLNYLGAVKDTLDEANAPPDNFNDIPAFYYNDVQFRYAFGEKMGYQLFLGAQNVFDKQPPLLPAGAASTVTGTETAAESYDPVGRFVYLGFDVKF